MIRILIFLMVSVSLIFSSSLLFARPSGDFEYITEARVGYDSRYYPEFAYGTGGAEGHSGAYVVIIVGVVNYDDLATVKMVAEHKTEVNGEMVSDFEVTLLEASKECVKVWPEDWNVEQYWSIRLKPEDWMMEGQWEITMKFTDSYGDEGKESVDVEVKRFSFPPEPTGIQFINGNLVWNSIGIPEAYGDTHVEYRVIHHMPGTFCADKSIKINDPSALIGLNRIRAIIPPDWWQAGDLIRVENRVYSNGRSDRGVRYFYLPYVP